MWTRKNNYPLVVDNQRTYTDDFDGDVHVWDIDKTYLSTHFSSLEGLMRIPVEFAIDKRSIAGMPEILRGLRRGSGAGFQCVPLYFVTASPPQMRRVLERKMLLDGVEHDGIIFKDWLGTFRSLRPGRLREQVGFKVTALLTGRGPRPMCHEYLFGDNAETDAEAFFLYSRIIHKDLVGAAAERSLRKAGVAEDDLGCIRTLMDTLPSTLGSVRRIFIRLERDVPREHYDQYNGLVVPIAHSCELAIALYGLDLVRGDVAQLACQAVCQQDLSVDFDAVIEDAVARGLVSQGRAADLVG
ncbi:MAG: hypothetical protein A2289_21015 [Deltaproteobacteria bacterium RIFOXYA12_FULL_58_15]|nr:MAG: hypothetical protein A2289_21015 [Deltaproteobacteria bacterium RIFOXYA12_FULL_58_15]